MLILFYKDNFMPSLSEKDSDRMWLSKMSVCSQFWVTGLNPVPCTATFVSISTVSASSIDPHSKIMRQSLPSLQTYDLYLKLSLLHQSIESAFVGASHPQWKHLTDANETHPQGAICLRGVFITIQNIKTMKGMLNDLDFTE